MKRKIGVVVTSRASYSRIKSVLSAIKKEPDLELLLIGAASLLLYKYGNVASVMEKDGFKLNEKVYMVVEGENPATMAKTVGIGIMELATVFDNYRPHIVISIADRFETICTAIAASYLNIPVAHIQGGEITGSIDEKVRHAVTKFSSYHFVANEHAARRVRLMGEDKKTIFVTGCPAIDLAKEVAKNYSYMNTKYLYAKYGGTGEKVDIDKDFIVIMQHPVTTEFEHSYSQMKETLMAVYETGIPAIVMWPNADAGSDLISKAIREFREKYKPKNFYFFINLGPEDFLALLIKSKGIIGNSSVGIRESSFLGIPAINIGTRQYGREHSANVINTGYKKEEIKKAVLAHLEKSSKFPLGNLYGDGRSGKRIANILTTVPFVVEKRFKE